MITLYYLVSCLFSSFKEAGNECGGVEIDRNREEIKRGRERTDTCNIQF